MFIVYILSYLYNNYYYPVLIIVKCLNVIIFNIHTPKKREKLIFFLSIIAVLKKYNLRRHYMTNHLSKYEKYICDATENVVIDFKRNFQS
ncbi:Uncharacterized protein FWK35_00036585 [Aphis craccivora]|uniref:Uncharacterized protein n=1 Tax=Aphis craccivora TaxID=307492 RepID=A0A6G0ZCX0_APHCR|nr:Uncharacterized protein FWK35_00036585 [Aphis craccivora]